MSPEREKKQITINMDLWFLWITVYLALFAGSPSLLDAIIYKMTDVKIWEKTNEA